MSNKIDNEPKPGYAGLWTPAVPGTYDPTRTEKIR